MKYLELVKEAQKEIKSRKEYGNKKIKYVKCPIWEQGDQINLWAYWQGFQLKDIDKKHVDILLVGQDWGNPNNDPSVSERIKKIQSGDKKVNYIENPEKMEPTDKNLCELFKTFDVDITQRNPGKRLFFTNYSLGYRMGSETGGMTKTLMKEDSIYFDKLVKTIQPKIIICLGKITFEMVSGLNVEGFTKQLSQGKPFKAYYLDTQIKVYGVAHCGARGCSNVGGFNNMKKTWDKIAKDYNKISD